METRVAKYASYRAEIEKMGEEDESRKSKSSKVVSDILKDEKKDLNQTLNLTDMMKAYELYDDKSEVKKSKKRKLGVAGKRILIYSIVASAIVLTLLIILLIVGLILIL